MIRSCGNDIFKIREWEIGDVKLRLQLVTFDVSTTQVSVAHSSPGEILALPVAFVLQEGLWNFPGIFGGQQE